MILSDKEKKIVEQIKSSEPCGPPIFMRLVNKHCKICSYNVSQVHHDICLYCVASLDTPNYILPIIKEDKKNPITMYEIIM